MEMSAASPTAVEELSLPCPICEYDLRGQVEPRCPECGYRFDWNELRDPARRLHPYLFEHHPESNVWSFIRTFLGSLLPARFWRTLHPAQKSSVRRLIAYGLIVQVMCLGPAVAMVLWNTYHYDRVARQMRPRIQAGLPAAEKANILRSHGTLQAWMDERVPILPNPRVLREAVRDWNTRSVLRASLLIPAWPVLTLVVLMVFRASMRRARVRTSHVLRCVIYTADGMIVAALALAVHVATVAYTQLTTPLVPAVVRPQRWLEFTYNAIPYALTGALVLMTFRLASAIRHYLRFDHSRATALASQIIVALLILVFMEQAFRWNPVTDAIYDAMLWYVRKQGG